MKKMMFALGMAVTVSASGGAVRWIDGEKIVVDGDKYAMNWILECDGKQYDFLEPRFKWGTFHHPKELAGKIEDSFSRRQDGDDLVETLVITNISDGPVNLWGATVSLPFNDNYPDAKECVKRRCKANLGLFAEAGRGGAAYLYPDMINGKEGRYLDPMANDQDWALAFASRWMKEWPRAKCSPLNQLRE